MEAQKKQLILIFSIVVAILCYLAYKVVRPFLIPILWAIVLGIAFHPMHRFIYTHIRKNALASLITLIIILLIILGPVAYLSYRLVAEILELSRQFGSQIQSSGGFHNYASGIVDNILSTLGLPATTMSATQIKSMLDQLAGHIEQELKEKASEAFSVSFDFFVMAVALFFVLKDGASALRRIAFNFPLSRERKDRIQSLVGNIVASSIYGTGVSMGLHAILAVVLFLIFGVPVPVLLAAAAGLLSVIPIIGSLFVWVGAIVYLVLQHRITAAIIVAVISAVGTQSIDHWLRPLLVGAHGRLSFVIVFFGILGGLECFGLIGLILGPLILILLISIVTLTFEIWNDPSATW